MEPAWRSTHSTNDALRTPVSWLYYFRDLIVDRLQNGAQRCGCWSRAQPRRPACRIASCRDTRQCKVDLFIANFSRPVSQASLSLYYRHWV